MEKMPAVFRDPTAPADSTNACYFALTGKGTIFDVPQGVRFADILDGTSNTLMFVEAKRDIPWTKPEDIPFDAGQAVPQLGGHYPETFLAAFCDGSVRALSLQLDPQLLKLLIMRADGQPVTLPEN
jgi:hypothetical protein